MSVFVRTSGAPRSAPSRRSATTYAPGQRHPPCKTVRVLRRSGRSLAVRERSELKPLAPHAPVGLA